MLNPSNKLRFVLSDVLKHPFFLKFKKNEEIKENLKILIFNQKLNFEKKIEKKLKKNYEKLKLRNFERKKCDFFENEIIEKFFLEFEDKIQELENDLECILLCENDENRDNEGFRKYSM